MGAAIIVIWVLCAIGGALIAGAKGRSAGLWAVICLVIGVFGILIVAVLPSQKAAEEQHGRVPCPACSELILPTANVCKHCGSSLTPLSLTQQASSAAPPAAQ